MQPDLSLTNLIVTHGAEALAKYAQIPAGKLVGYDIETTPKPTWKSYEKAGLDPHTTDIRTVQFYTPATECLVIDLWEFPLFRLREDLHYVAHYAIFELMHSRMRFDVKFAGGLEDTILMEQLIYATRAVPHAPDPDDEVPEEEQGLAKFRIDGYSLEACLNRHFGISIDKSLQKSDWGAETLSDEQLRYAALDAKAAYVLGLRQIQIIKQENMMEVYKLQREMLHVVADMQITGIAVDWDKHAKLVQRWETELAQLNEQCAQLFGQIEVKGRMQPVNVNSSLQMAQWLRLKKPELVSTWPRTAPSKLYPLGNLQFGSKVIPDYAAEHPEFGVLLQQKKLQKLVSSFGNSLLKHKNPVTNRIHPQYKLGATSTGRMSCNSPNLQQSPKDPEFRELFVAPVGNRIVGGDFNQIEVQVQGQLSHDEVILANYAAGDDIYMTLARKIFPKKKITKTSKERQVAKQLVLSLGYGMGATKFKLYCKQAGVIISQEEAETYHRAYHETFTTYSQWCSSVRTSVEINGEAVTKLGKRRKIASDKVYTQAPNLTVQGTAAELLQLCMVKLRAALQPYQAVIVAAIHDEILIECDAREADSIQPIFEMCARQAFEQLFAHPSKDILQANIGITWASVK